MKPWTFSRYMRTLAIIALAMLLGIAVDEGFQMLFPNYSRNILRVFLQFMVSVALVAAIETLSARYLPLDIVANVFFLAVFLGAQWHLAQAIGRINILKNTQGA